LSSSIPLNLFSGSEEFTTAAAIALPFTVFDLVAATLEIVRPLDSELIPVRTLPDGIQ
jgi:hypothetical protein